MTLAISHPSLVQISNSGSVRPGGGDIWSLVQSQNPTRPPGAAAPYIHPLVRQSMARMNQNSLEMCTEILGSETGWSEFIGPGWFSISSSNVAKEMTGHHDGFTEVVNGSHHRSSRRSPARSFPPPLSSISSGDRPSIHIRSHRRDGRLVLEAVPVVPQNILHARRHEGRLLLSFADTNITSRKSSDTIQEEEQVTEAEDVNDGEEAGAVVEYEGEEEEEVEVVDRGTVVEVKFSTQPQQQSGAKALRSSIMINKFVGGAPFSNENRWASLSPQRRMPPTMTAAVAAVIVASSVSASLVVGERSMSATKSKLLFTSKRRNREEMMHNIWRCSMLRRPLFFWEPCCIAAT